MRSRRLCLAFCGLLLTGPGGLLGQSGPAPTKPTAEAPPKKRVPTFTDDDLARYREERLRRESPDAEAAPPPSDAVQPGAAPALAPATKAALGSVEIRDLNGTLPPEARSSAEAAGRRFVAFFGLPQHETLVIPLRYFPDTAAYRDHLDRNVDSRMSWAGYYDPGKREIVVGSTPDYVPVLLHKINHFVFDTAFDEAPVWLREGLAEYFETASANPEGLVVADEPRHRRQLAEWLKGRREPDLCQLLALNRSMWREHEVAGSARVRALSWSVVAFLMSSEGGRKAIHEFLASLKNQRGLYSLAAFDRTFPGGAPPSNASGSDSSRREGRPNDAHRHSPGARPPFPDEPSAKEWHYLVRRVGRHPAQEALEVVVPSPERSSRLH